MKLIIILLLSILASTAFSQNKYKYIQFNKLTEVEGTKYVIASIDNRSKFAENENEYLLFINTDDGSSKQVDFPIGGNIRQVEQIKIDSIGINKIIVTANTVDLNGKRGIDWSDPQQIFAISTDGKEKTQLTEDKFFSRTWAVNNETGTLVITGHYDTNGNGKYDKTDKNEILIFDLKTLELKNKI